MLIRTFQFAVNHRNTFCFIVCFPKFDFHQIKFNSIQNLLSFPQLTQLWVAVKCFHILCFGQFGLGSFLSCFRQVGL